MPAFVVLYSGETIASAKLIAMTGDAKLVAQVAAKILGEQEQNQPEDPASAKLERGRTEAVRVIRRETTNARA